MPTTNPVPSADPTDLLFNAQRLDEVVNSPNAEYATRLGEQRMTAKGATDSIRAFNSRGVWVTTTVYAVRDLVFVTPTWYVCVTAHTSGATFAGDAANWRVHQGLTKEELADPTSASNGDALVAVVHPSANGAERTQHEKNQDFLTSADFLAPADANTAAGRGFVNFTSGTYAYAPISFNSSWSGQGIQTEPGTPGAASIEKAGNGVLAIMALGGQVLRDLSFDGKKATYTGNGVQMGADRQLIDGVSVFNSAGDNLHIGGVGAGGVFNANIWQGRRLISYGAGGRGVYINHTGGPVSGPWPDGEPDVNAGLMLGTDIRNTTGIGYLVANAIDCTHIGVVVQQTTGRSIVLTRSARGHAFLHPYTEGGNGGGGLPGDELDIELGAEQNMVLGMRFQTPGGQSGFRDVNAPGKNYVLLYEDGIGCWVVRGKIAVWNRQEDGASTTVDLEGFLGTNGVRTFRLAGALSGTSGGLLTVLTKIDGGAEVAAAQFDALGRTKVLNAFVPRLRILTYSASMTIDAATGDTFEITANNGTAFTINAPTNPSTGQRIKVKIRNTSGGALGAVTFDAIFKLTAWVSPATTFSRSIFFQYDGANWVEDGRTAADVPN